MIALLLASRLFAPAAAATACEALTPVSSKVQVAWISRIGRTVGPNTSIEVVRVGELRDWIDQEHPDPQRLVKGLGMVGRKATPNGRAAQRGYKVVLFDVMPEWLCRPIEGGQPGEVVDGVPTCSEGDQRPVRHHRRGWTGCGYSLDTGSSTRGLEVYRITWEQATAEGFCLFPLERFLDEA